MEDEKKYIPPECVDFSGGRIVRAEDTCTSGSTPDSNTPCWSGTSPQGYGAECDPTGVNPSGCGNGSTPYETPACNSGSSPDGCDTGTSPS